MKVMAPGNITKRTVLEVTALINLPDHRNRYGQCLDITTLN